MDNAVSDLRFPYCQCREVRLTALYFDKQLLPVLQLRKQIGQFNVVASQAYRRGEFKQLRLRIRAGIAYCLIVTSNYNAYGVS